ncbi:MAG: DUF3800 domain-containing protein [Oceanicaulis sp.]
MIDIDQIRRTQIKIHGLSGVDLDYIFYHDETNNIKKLRLEGGRFNVANPSVFVLGGIVYSGPQRTLDIQALRDALHIQKSANEIKFKHVAKGDFLEVLSSKRLTTFLRWISENDFNVHYHALDPIHWATVDIIDSIIHGLSEPRLYALHVNLKADLTTLLRADLEATARIFHRYDYPDLVPENRKPFLNDLLAILERSDELLPEFNAMMLKGMLQAGRHLSNLEFIEGFTAQELIKSFAMFYVNRIAVFKNAKHILDNEDSVQDEIEAMGLSSNGERLNNYRFADSKAEPGIQISDIVVGLIGKMHTWLAQNPSYEVASERATLQGVELKNVELLRDLIDASHEANIAFLHHLTSANDLEKMNIFLRNFGSGYEV